jgi:UDP-N-acetylmuramate--alanine ligase
MKIYFIGIGGIGMSALAQLLLDTGNEVSGSDREESPTTELLTSKGVTVYIGQSAENVPSDATRIVFSEAVWEDNAERMRAKELGIPQTSYFDMLGEVSKGKRTIAVSGTHGKTTTTGMTAKILSDAGVSPTAVVGSIVQDFKSNYLKGTSDLFVVEACEYKRDFLSLTPFVLVVTNIEWDHTDYYKDLADLQSAFRTHPNIAPLLEGLSARVIDYKKEPAYTLRLPGEFNQDNARAAAAAARVALPEIENTIIYDSVANFHGTWRRFEYKGKTKKGADVYDDYAHHPTAVEKTLTELRKRVPAGRKLLVAFHPHLYSRTRDLMEGFATAFKDADGVFIAPIYAAREVDDGSVSNATLAAEIAKNGTPAEPKTFDEIRSAFDEYAGEGDVVVTMGAGDIYKVADAITASATI